MKKILLLCFISFLFACSQDSDLSIEQNDNLVFSETTDILIDKDIISLSHNDAKKMANKLQSMENPILIVNILITIYL
ncbi:MAG: hypothetical protein ACRC6V_19715 [Bacteroidales bacterium]